MSRSIFSILVFLFASAGLALSQEGQSDAEIAKKLSNPLSSLITFPFLFEYNSGFGSADGYNATLYFQPVYPIKLNDEYSILTRTILPITWQDDIAGRSGSQFGLGDTQQSFFLTPKAKTTPFGEFSYGVGPAVTWPTSTNRLLGPGTLGLGPTGVAIVQNSGWTYGALVTQQWGIAETRSNVPDLNTTLLEPFLAYTTSNQWTFSVLTESTYNWTSREWAVPIKANIAKLVRFGKLPVQLQAGVTYWADSPTGGPNGLGARTQATVVLPTNWRQYRNK